MNPADEKRYDSKPLQPKEPRFTISISEREALADRHYDIDDISECFSSDDLKRMDAMARCGDFEKLGREWNALTSKFRDQRLEVAVSYLEDVDAENHENREDAEYDAGRDGQ
jgi:hypothetical protein